MALKKFCLKSGCSSIVESGYCDKHKHLESQVKAARNKEYDKSVRNKRDLMYSLFYHSKEWEAVRQAAIVRDKGLCQMCLKDNIIKPLDVVHHIVPIKINWLLRLILSNLICLCERHHQQVHNKLEGEGGFKKFQKSY